MFFPGPQDEKCPCGRCDVYTIRNASSKWIEQAAKASGFEAELTRRGFLKLSVCAISGLAMDGWPGWKREFKSSAELTAEHQELEARHTWTPAMMASFQIVTSLTYYCDRADCAR